MPSGRATTIAGAPGHVQELLHSARRGVMTTVGSDGSPHAVPVVFAVVGDEIVSPIDHKPKSGRTLARVKNLERDPRIALLVDLWDEDWSRLAWTMVRGQAAIDAAPAFEVLAAINARYQQYQEDEVHDAIIRIRPHSLLWWTYS